MTSALVRTGGQWIDTNGDELKHLGSRDWHFQTVPHILLTKVSTRVRCQLTQLFRKSSFSKFKAIIKVSFEISDLLEWNDFFIRQLLKLIIVVIFWEKHENLKDFNPKSVFEKVIRIKKEEWGSLTALSRKDL